MDVIILSGGKGTRLQEVVKDIPKTMAKVNNKPFLEYLLEELKKYHVKNVILAVGYKKEIIKSYFGNYYKGINIIYSEELEPLGTGGAIKKALELSKDKDVIVLNGDVYSNVNLNKLMECHMKSKRNVTLTLKYMEDFDRYGVVEFNKDNIITKFEEKKRKQSGYINVGVYAIKKDVFEKINDKNFESNFSIEKDFFEKYAEKEEFGSYIYDGEFIDIGIPSDYEKLKKRIEQTR